MATLIKTEIHVHRDDIIIEEERYEDGSPAFCSRHPKSESFSEGDTQEHAISMLLEAMGLIYECRLEDRYGKDVDTEIKMFIQGEDTHRVIINKEKSEIVR